MSASQTLQAQAMGTLDEPLLKRTTPVRAKCSGCAVALAAADGSPPPYLHLFLVGVVVLCNVLPISSVYSFGYFMVRDFGIADEDIGFYLGFLGSSFMFGRFLASVQCGMAADRHGRRPIMIASVVGVIIFSTTFGASTSFWMAVSSRLILGCFNGSVAPVKVYASELCSDEHQAVGIAAVGTAVGLGNMLGPVIGGYLSQVQMVSIISQPALKYPALFPAGSLFDRFPYLLPCLIISVASIFGTIITLHLPETLHFHSKEQGGVADDDGMEKGKGEVAAPRFRDAAAVSSRQEKQLDSKPSPSLLKNWPLISSTTVYCLSSVHDMAYLEIFSLYALSPKSIGGLGLSTQDVGTVLAVAGSALLIFQFTMFSPLARRLGAVNLTRAATVLSLPLLFAYPPMAGLTGLALWVSLLLASIAKIVLTSGTTSGATLLINNSVKPSQRGTANGVSMSLVSLFKTIGPAAGGAFFAWAQTRHSDFLPGNQIVFCMLGLLALLATLCTCGPCLPPSLDKRKHEEEEDDD